MHLPLDWETETTHADMGRVPTTYTEKALGICIVYSIHSMHRCTFNSLFILPDDFRHTFLLSGHVWLLWSQQTTNTSRFAK